jgi:hypothetical protein
MSLLVFWGGLQKYHLCQWLCCRIVNDQTEVAETFNEFFVNVAKDIGKDNCAVNQEHPSVKVIIFVKKHFFLEYCMS